MGNGWGKRQRRCVVVGVKDYMTVVSAGVLFTGMLAVAGVGTGNDLVLMGVMCIALGGMGLAVFAREKK